jgi:thiamine-monophosphate kinase
VKRHPWNLLHAGSRAGPASEEDCLALINALFPERSGHFPLNRDDDCAALALPPGPLALSTDYFMEDVHFRAAYFTPAEAGAKALSVAVSDLAAAGAAPLGFSLGLLLPEGLSRAALADCLAGMAAKARACAIILTGGDLSRGPCLGFCLTVWGAPAARDAPFLSRGRAGPGDRLFLIGEIGLARVGLAALETYGRDALSRYPAACAAHLDPPVFLAEGQALARLASPSLSLMDCSDGPARDLPRLLAGLGADLHIGPGLIPEEVRREAGRQGMDPERIFLAGGEDYALLGSCPESLWPLAREAVPAARLLGTVRRDALFFCNGAPLSLPSLAGFDHFAGKAAGGKEKGNGKISR